MHCWGGRGRAGLVGACLLAALYGLGAEEALERVQRSFDTRKDGERANSWACGVPRSCLDCGHALLLGCMAHSLMPAPPGAASGGRRSPETDEQHAFVRSFIEQLNAGASA